MSHRARLLRLACLAANSGRFFIMPMVWDAALKVIVVHRDSGFAAVIKQNTYVFIRQFCRWLNVAWGMSTNCVRISVTNGKVHEIARAGVVPLVPCRFARPLL